MDQLSDKIDDEEEDFDYGEDFIPQTDFTWPTESEQCLNNRQSLVNQVTRPLCPLVRRPISQLITLYTQSRPYSQAEYILITYHTV